jgi:hypothetical protein
MPFYEVTNDAFRGISEASLVDLKLKEPGGAGDYQIQISTREHQDKKERLEVINSLESDIDTNLQKAEALRQSILKKVFASGLVPQDPNNEPASSSPASAPSALRLRHRPTNLAHEPSPFPLCALCVICVICVICGSIPAHARTGR